MNGNNKNKKMRIDFTMSPLEPFVLIKQLNIGYIHIIIYRLNKENEVNVEAVNEKNEVFECEIQSTFKVDYKCIENGFNLNNKYRNKDNLTNVENLLDFSDGNFKRNNNMYGRSCSDSITTTGKNNQV